MAGVYYDLEVSSTIYGAWGLRQLVSTYTGAIVRIRDTSDNSEQDVGFDENGDLNSFTVAGDAVVVRLYDQSGNGADLYNGTASGQPTLLAGVTPAGGYAIKFDGSDDFLGDVTVDTTRPYMVSKPVLVVAGGGAPGGSSNGLVAGIPNSQPSNGSPWNRLSILRDAGSGSQWVAFYDGNSTADIDVGLWKPSSGWGAMALDPARGKFYSGLDVGQDASFTADTAITYPNNTRMCLGSATSSDRYSGYVTECVILDSDLIVPADLKSCMQKVKGRYLSKPLQVWRLESLARFGSPTNQSHAFAEWQAATSVGGADIIPTNVLWWQSISYSTEPASRLFDNNNATNWWSGSAGSAPFNVGFDLGSPQPIVEMKIVADAGSSGGATPSVFKIYYLGNDGEWKLVADVDNTAEGVTSNKVFTIPLLSVDPDSGTVFGGTEVTIRGPGFTGASGVLFGTEPATSVVVVDDATITCVTPFHEAGTVDVTIQFD